MRCHETRPARHHQALRQRGGQRLDLPHGRARRDPLPARRERRRQVDADERALRPATRPTRARSSSTATVRNFTGPGDAMARRHRHGPPALHAHPRLHRGGERDARQRGDGLPPASLDVAAARERVTEISERFGFHVDPDALVEDLPVGVQQRVEIIKALSRDAELLVFDEPTAVLTPSGDRRADGHHAPAPGGGEGDRLHHPQAPRGPRGRRPDHRRPPRQGRRRGRPRRPATPSWPR